MVRVPHPVQNPVQHPVQRPVTAVSAVDVAAVFGERWVSTDGCYADSPFLPLKRLPSRTKGAEFEYIAECFLIEQGYAVTKAGSSAFDRLIDDLRVEIKGSFLGDGSGQFRWQQIRLDQECDYYVFLAVWPDRVEYYACTHEAATAALRTRDAQGRLPHNQHGGSGVDSGTFFIDGLPADIPWFLPLATGFPPPVASLAPARPSPLPAGPPASLPCAAGSEMHSETSTDASSTGESPQLTLEEARSLELFRAVAAKLPDNPEWVADAKARLVDLRAVHSRSAVYFDEWEQLLDGPLSALLERMVATDQVARDLRSAAPFGAVLDQNERLAIIARVRAEFRAEHTQR